MAAQPRRPEPTEQPASMMGRLVSLLGCATPEWSVFVAAIAHA